MSASRPVLNVVDDPVSRQLPEQPTESTPTLKPRSASVRRTPAPTPGPGTATASTEGPAEAPQTAQPAEERDRYRDEPKKAVFGRIPRSLSRRLERALVELRDQNDDLTQEQLLAALLDRYVDPSDPTSLTELAATIGQYRERL